LIRLRLQRKGRKKRPYYHIVVADIRSPRDGRVIERVGRFDNVSEKKELTIDEERIIHWLKIGAQPTDTVRSILKAEGILYKMHLLRWGKSDEEIDVALKEWRKQRVNKTADDDAVSRKEREKAMLIAEEKEYKKQLEKKAAEAKAALEKEKEEKEAKAQAEAEETAEAAVEAESEETKAEAEETKAESEAPADDETEMAAKEEKAEESAAVEATEEKDAKKEPEAKAETEEVTKAPEEEAKAESKEEKSADEKAEKTEAATEKEEEEEKAPSATETPDTTSLDMNATEAIDHIKNTPLEELEGFVPDDEERVTVLRAWESKTSGEE